MIRKIALCLILAGCSLISKAQDEINYNGYYVFVPDSSSSVVIK